MTTTASSTEPGTTRIATSADGTPIAFEVTGSGPALVLVDGAGVYDAVPQPTLVVAGGKSPAYLQNAQAAVAAALPDGRLETLHGQTHMIKAKVTAPVVAAHLLATPTAEGDAS